MSALSSSSIPLLDAETALANLRSYGLGKRDKYLAFFSSVYSGIVTDETLMSVPVDDHLVHRGHAVFDTACVENGFLYNADAHINRILRSARSAEIEHSFTFEYIKAVIVAVSRAAKDPCLSIRYWISSGAGDFSYSPAGCISPSFYCIAFKGFHLPSDPAGLSEVTISCSQVGMKQHPIGTLKSNNYMANVLLHLAAKRAGGNYGIWVGPDGNLKEGPVNSVILVDAAGVVKTPPFTDILASCTCRRALDICEEQGMTVRQEAVTPQDAYEAREIFFVGGDTHIIAVSSLDGKSIGGGQPGPVFTMVRDKILKEAGDGSYRGEKIMM